MRANIHVTVASICEQNGRFLMVEEQPSGHKTSVFNQPAGHVELNETITEAVVRETLEETGCLFSPEAIVGIYQYQVDETMSYLRYCFCGAITQPEAHCTLDPDIIDVHWMDATTILQHPDLRSPLVTLCLQDYLQGQRYPLAILKSAPKY